MKPDQSDTPSAVNHREDRDLRRAVLHQLDRVVESRRALNCHRASRHDIRCLSGVNIDRYLPGATDVSVCDKSFQIAILIDNAGASEPAPGDLFEHAAQKVAAADLCDMLAGGHCINNLDAKQVADSSSWMVSCEVIC